MLQKTLRMTLTTLALYITVAATIITAIISYLKQRENTVWVSFIQSFVGILFIFSGYVKVVDPLGTAYKMEEYFQEFYSTFSESGLSFLAGVFPVLERHALAFSIFIILFELILGIVLLTGYKRKYAAWALLIISLIFTGLTGFTYLTGYVPDGANFFDFSQWGPHDPNNMKVTDCGCFGDFIKIDAFATFIKSAFLLLPSVILILKWRQMHRLFSPGIRRLVTLLSIVGFFIYALSNFMWNLPDIDFRPFSKGTDLRAKRQAELDAMSNIKILSWKLKNRNTGQVVSLPNERYMKEFANYPKSEWKVVGQKQTEPEVAKTKASDFEVTDIDGNDLSDDILDYKGYSLWIVAYRLKGGYAEQEESYRDTVYRMDTIKMSEDSIIIKKVIDSLVVKKHKVGRYLWDPDYIKYYNEKINPLVEPAIRDSVRVFAIIGGAGPDQLESFAEAIGGIYPLYQADDILLKTIIRSNPGVLLMKDGKILDKWHIKQLPAYQKIKEAYLR